jgi:hypothetical protein
MRAGHVIRELELSAPPPDLWEGKGAGELSPVVNGLISRSCLGNETSQSLSDRARGVSRSVNTLRGCGMVHPEQACEAAPSHTFLCISLSFDCS